MANFLHKMRLVLDDPGLRKRIFFTLSILIIFRALSAIPIPGVDALRLEQFLSGNDFLGLLNIFSGGGLSRLSIIMLGVGPYITASIIMQLMTIVFPKMKEMYQEEGEAGRKKFSQYSRLLTVPLAILQTLSFTALLKSQGILGSLSLFDTVVNVLVVTAASILLMWLGELITEFGIGNGVSLIIFAGIVSALPNGLIQLYVSFDPSLIPTYLAFLVAGLLIIWGVVIITESERPIPVTYAKQVRGGKMYGGVSTYLPLRVNQAGVIPILFAISLLIFPQMIASFLLRFSNTIVHNVAQFVVNTLANQWIYSSIYFVLVFAFTYFYTALTFDPDSISKNLQRSGAFIPGIRPGFSTSEYLSKTTTRLTFLGALFLSVIAVLPLVTGTLTGIQSLALGGTGLLIVVSVVIDLIKKVDSQISAREY